MAATDKQMRDVKRIVKPLIDKWQRRMGLGQFSLGVSYFASVADMPAPHNRIEDGNECVAYCSTAWEYKDITIGINVEAMARKTPLGIEQDIIHELCHVLVNPMREFERIGMKIDEYTCSCLERALFFTNDEARKEGMKEEKRKGKARGKRSKRKSSNVQI